MRLAITVQVKDVVGITRLASDNFMQCIAYLYIIGLSSSQQAVSEFCLAIKKLLRKFISWPEPATMDRYAHEFQRLAADSVRSGGS